MRDSSLSWKKKLAQGFNSVEALLRFLELPVVDNASIVERQFPSRIPLSFAQRMQKGNPNDPLLLQVLARTEELKPVFGYDSDPLDEAKSNPVQGVVHKYRGRVLLTLSGVCAVNCRYCFRRHFPYNENNPGRAGWSDALDYIRKDESIHEIIFSGGDPLLVSNTLLASFIEQLELIQHVHTVRFHTRIPVVFPERIDKELIRLLTATTLNKVIVLHTNHAQELDVHVADVCRHLRLSGCHLLNQTVLLAGINDDSTLLAALSQNLFFFGIIPYYLHLLDKVQGAAHFDVPLAQAQALYSELQTMLPGYLVPRLVREEPGKPCKTLVI
jgi:EF-P beta-lysylation protein EpmB